MPLDDWMAGTSPAMTVRAADVTSLVSSIESQCGKGGFLFLENISSASVSSCASNDPLRLGQRPGLRTRRLRRGSRRSFAWPRRDRPPRRFAGQKIWKSSKWVWKPCNPLKSHNTAKGIFGKAWRKAWWRPWLVFPRRAALSPDRELHPDPALGSRWGRDGVHRVNAARRRGGVYRRGCAGRFGDGERRAGLRSQLGEAGVVLQRLLEFGAGRIVLGPRRRAARGEDERGGDEDRAHLSAASLRSSCPPQ